MSFPLQTLYNWYRQTIANPKYRWWMIGGTLIYLLSPFDIAPDFIPFIGQVDDALLVTIVATELSQVLVKRVKATKSRSSQTAASAASDSVEVKAVSTN